MEDRTRTVFDLFCGTGGFSKGFENSGGGFQVRFGIDILPLSVETFRLNHKDAAGVVADIRDFRLEDAEELTGLKRGAVDVVIGGPPCQGFSSIRPNRGSDVDDPRNALFEQFAAYVNHFRPRVLVFENVVGLATHKNGEAIDQIQDRFEQLGYDTDWRIMNAAHFGVPQKRERLILLGVERGARIAWPAPTHSGSFKTIGVRDSSRLLVPRVGSSGASPTLFDDSASCSSQPLPSAITTMEAISDLPAAPSGVQLFEYSGPPRNPYQDARRIGAGSRLEMHIGTKHTPKMLEIIRHSGPNIDSIPKHLITSGFSSCYSRMEADEPAVTITVNFIHPASNKCIHPEQDRALTLREGARLQSFDDTFRFAGPLAKVAKQIGNAVPPLLGRALAETIADAL